MTIQNIRGRDSSRNGAVVQSSVIAVALTGGGGGNVPVGSVYGNYLYWDGSAYSVGGTNTIKLGNSAGKFNQADNAVAIGLNAGGTNQGTYAVAIGINAGINNQNTGCVAIGAYSAQSNQSNYAIAIGMSSGTINQGDSAVAIGFLCGNTGQCTESVAVGYQASRYYQKQYSIAVGSKSGYYSQSQCAVAIGSSAGCWVQQSNAIALGYHAGFTGQGTNAIAIGYNAGQTDQPANSIVINATDSTNANGVANGCCINPIRSTGVAYNTLVYDSSAHELMVSNTKTFVIQHPVYEDKYLVHGCLEGPESGVYYRGTDEILIGENVEIILPNYTKHWIDFTININLIVSHSNYKNIRIYGTTDVENGKFTVFGTNGCKFHWTVFAKRCDISVEPSKNNVKLCGKGPYTWIE